MKRFLFTALGTLVFGTFVCAQNASSVVYLEENNVKALFHSNGELFSDPVNFSARYVVPNGTGLTAIYNAGLWVSAIDSADTTLHVSAHDLSGDPNMSGFYEGPIADNYNSSWDGKYRRSWNILKTEIDQHIMDYNTPNYVVPNNIASWPAHGDTANGEAQNLAPFVDENQNGIYDPENGDHPCIKGDQALYIIYNDVRSNIALLSLGIEVHLLAYQYSTSNDVDNTVFLEYKLYNRSQRTYRDVLIGKMLDFDLGCPTDDFIASDPSLNLYYVYNGDNFDDNCLGINGYGSDPGVIGAMVLNNDLHAFINYNNAGTGSSFRTQPALPIDYRNFLNATWKDGAHMVEGGNGHPSDAGATSTQSNFVFSGDPSDTSTWSEVSALNIKGDRKGVGSVYFDNWRSQEALELSYAIIYAKGVNTNNLENIDELRSAATVVQDFYDSISVECLPSWTGLKEVSDENRFSIYPNPSYGSFTIKTEQRGNNRIQVLNSMASLVYENSFSENQIDVVLPESLGKGVYFIRVISENGVQTERLILK